MKITDAIIVPHNSPSTSKPENTPFKVSSIANSALELPKAPSSMVSISGQALLRQRIFFSENPNSRLPLQIKNTVETRMQPSVNFLTESDRDLLSQAFEFAQEQGADLHYVDVLAFELALYRQADNGRIMLPLNQGKDFDLEGHKVSYSFTPKDTATASRILKSEALNSTQLDKGFIRYSTHKDYGVFHHVNFEFMEQIINKFSSNGDNVPPLDSKFYRYESPKENYIKHLSKEVYDVGGKGSPPDMNAAAGKKKTVNQQPPAPPETLKDILRRIIFKAMHTSFSTRVPSLAEFLMKMRR